jgi:hypothetical protein
MRRIVHRVGKCLQSDAFFFGFARHLFARLLGTFAAGKMPIGPAGLIVGL